MPTYEYACEKCGCTFDKFQPIADAALKTCPKEICAEKKWGRGKVRRVIGAGGGLIFKGSGFYITDYRSDNYKAGAKKEAPSSTGGDVKPAANSTPSAPAKAEAKPAKPTKPAAK